MRIQAQLGKAPTWGPTPYPFYLDTIFGKNVPFLCTFQQQIALLSHT